MISERKGTPDGWWCSSDETWWQQWQIDDWRLGVEFRCSGRGGCRQMSGCRDWKFRDLTIWWLDKDKEIDGLTIWCLRRCTDWWFEDLTNWWGSRCWWFDDLKIGWWWFNDWWYTAKMDVVDTRLAGDVQQMILILIWQRGCCGTLERNRSGIIPKITTTTLHHQFTYGVLDDTRQQTIQNYR